ncbi:hypothetical protein KIN20_003199 [Parelaphostrongylus tenuis]|uniref:Uncharacterized protein n=1 Tax=Parelaphostrongylus tenuis TaxID=148309 RepID=A0AAD5LZR8_PARTN|nr:hypothetical protein KIN20_003199 [Parelaphostrongylus tenuis]
MPLLQKLNEISCRVVTIKMALMNQTKPADGWLLPASMAPVRKSVITEQKPQQCND